MDQPLSGTGWECIKVWHEVDFAQLLHRRDRHEQTFLSFPFLKFAELSQGKHQTCLNMQKMQLCWVQEKTNLINPQRLAAGMPVSRATLSWFHWLLHQQDPAIPAGDTMPGKWHRGPRTTEFGDLLWIKYIFKYQQCDTLRNQRLSSLHSPPPLLFSGLLLLWAFRAW